MDMRRAAAKRMMWLAVAVGTILCVVGTVLVFVAAVAGFALLFISFCVFSVVPFQAFGLAGSQSRDTETRPPAEDHGLSEVSSTSRLTSHWKISYEASTRRRRR